MSAERQPSIPSSSNFSLEGIRNGESNLSGTAVVFRDPFLVPQTAWREILRYQIYSQDPSYVALINQDGTKDVIHPHEFTEFRDLDRKLRRDFLDEWSFRLTESSSAVIGRYTSR